MAGFKLQIVTPLRTVFQGTVDSVIAPGLDGYFGVLAHHAPLVAVLGRGNLRIRQARIETTWRVSEGFIEVSDNQAIVLVESAESDGEPIRE